MNHRFQILSTADAIGFLVAAGELESFPALPWALDAAMEETWRLTDSQTPVGRALRRWENSSRLPGNRFKGVTQTRRALVENGRLSPEGSGRLAILTVDPSWRHTYAAELRYLPGKDRSALRRGAQRLVAIRTMLSKNGASEESDRSGTS